MPPKTKKQHYVPQFLLRHFGTGTRKNPRIWVLDKSNKETRNASIRDVAHENAFYEYHEANGTHIELENLMQQMDSIGARIINEIVRRGILAPTAEDRVWLSYFIACQMVRTPQIRKDMDNVRQMIINKWGPNVTAEGDSRPISELGHDDTKLSSLLLIMEDVPEYAKLLQKLVWFLAEAPATYPFVISDHPVTRHNMIDRPGRGNLGLKNKGIEIYMPISPTLSLHLVCPILAQVACENGSPSNQYLNSIKTGSPVFLNSDNVDFSNSQQVIWSERWVFGRNREVLDLPLDMLRTNPELMSGPGIRQNPNNND